MKLEINIVPKIKETIVKIFADSMNSDVLLVQSILESSSVNRLVGFKDDEVSLLEDKDIVRFFTDDKKIFAQTLNGDYLIRLRMYELEERFRSNTFIRISQGELVNLDYIKKLDLSFKGTIALEFSTGDISYVSRRSLKAFKNALGL